jgi:hypothetical protein
MEKYRERRARERRPSLTLVPDPVHGEIGGPIKIKVGKFECAFLRLVVRAEPDKDPAVGVYVRLDRVRVENGSPPPGLPAVTGMWLAWSDVGIVNPRAEKMTTTIPGGSEARLV